MPMARASLAMAAPMWPVPTMPRTLPCRYTLSPPVQRPAFSSAVWKYARLASASMRPKACSATIGAVLPGMLQIAIPSSRATARSKASVPIPHTVAMRRRGKARKASAGHFTALRVFIKHTASFARSIRSSSVRGRSVCTITSP